MKGTDFFGTIGFLTSIIYYIFSPIQFLFNLKNKNINLEYISFFGFGVLFLNGILFFFYSVAKSTREEYELMELCNLIGAMTLFIYIILYICYMYSGYIQFIYISIFTLFSIILSYGEYNLIIKSEIFAKIIFYTSNVINVFIYLPIGFNILKIIKNKYPEILILNTSKLGLLNSLSWLIFGIKSVFFNDGNSHHIIIANILGLLICIIQIILYYKFLKLNPPKNDDKNEILTDENNEKEKNIKEENEKEEKDDLKNMLDSLY